MIYPTSRAVLIMGLGVPIALLVAVLVPGAWTLGLGWIVVTFVLMIVDLGLSTSRKDISITPELPEVLFIGSSDPASFDLSFKGNSPPRGFEARLETGELIETKQSPSTSGVAFTLRPIRRGVSQLKQLWYRWQGPLGLVQRQTSLPLNTNIAITPDVRSVKKEALRLFSRDALFGSKVELDRGDGSEFDALREFTQGMDRRTIDWKQSARHRQLIAKEFRNERNHPIYFVVDTGRLMSQPVNGVPRIDYAVNASLLMAYVSLKLGDRVGFFGFDSRPNLTTRSVASAQSFPLLQRQIAKLDYSTEETNYTLGLTRLSNHLDRRSLIVVFTDFADTTSAERMIENLGRLLKRHLVIFVAFRDEELEALIHKEPETPEDVTRAVVADELLKEREIVLSRLQRLGAQIVEARAADVGSDLLNRYLDLKNQDRL